MIQLLNGSTSCIAFTVKQPLCKHAPCCQASFSQLRMSQIAVVKLLLKKKADLIIRKENTEPLHLA